MILTVEGMVSSGEFPVYHKLRPMRPGYASQGVMVTWDGCTRLTLWVSCDLDGDYRSAATSTHDSIRSLTTAAIEAALLVSGLADGVAL